MKTIIKIAIALIIATSTWSCNFLEVERTGKNDIPKFFADIDGLRTALPGIYRQLYGIYDADYTKYSEVAADMVYLPVGFDDMWTQYEFKSRPEDEKGAPGLIWEKGYEALANVNNILYYGAKLKEKFPKDAQEIDMIFAETLFIRAMVHLFLCNTYSQPYNFTSDASHLGIPVAAKIFGVNDKIIRPAIKDTYKIMISDLEQSIKLFGQTKPKGTYYASPLACKAFLARIYLYMGDWEKARDYASEVITQKPLTQGIAYVDMFTQESSAYETVFRLSGYKIGSHRLRSYYYTETESNKTAIASQKYINTFYDQADLRHRLMTGTTTLKYAYGKDKIPGSTQFEEDLFYAPILLRSSEMYLIRAEAYCKQSSPKPELAADDLKAIIGRALQQQPSQVTLVYNGIDDLIEVIKRERILELSFEGHRLFDILRYKENLVRDEKTTSPVKQLTYPNNLFVLPISRIETEANPTIQQNPGY